MTCSAVLSAAIGALLRRDSSPVGDVSNWIAFRKQQVASFWADIAVPARRKPGLRFANPPVGPYTLPYQRYIVDAILPQVNLANSPVVSLDTQQHECMRYECPDVSTIPVGYELCSHVVVTFVQVKPSRTGGSSVHPFTDTQRGQVVRYARLLLDSQPRRTHITAALTDCVHVEFIRVYVADPAPSGASLIEQLPFRIEHTSTMSLSNPQGNANRYLRALLTSTTFFPAVRIAGVTINSHRRLGHSRSSQVFEQKENATRAVKVCVAADLVANEVAVLTTIGQVRPPIPRVVHLWDHSDCALVLTRCGASVDRYRAWPVLGRHFAELVATFQQLHALHIFHRDARPPNILVQTARDGSAVSLVLSDFGHAVASAGPAPMAGAPLLYFSESMLRERRRDPFMNRYTFTAADDLHIFLRGIFLLYQVEGPSHAGFPDMPSENQLQSLDAWSTYWQHCFAIEPWRTMSRCIDAVDATQGAAPRYHELAEALTAALGEMPLSEADSEAVRVPAAAVVVQQPLQDVLPPLPGSRVRSATAALGEGRVPRRQRRDRTV